MLAENELPLFESSAAATAKFFYLLKYSVFCLFFVYLRDTVKKMVEDIYESIFNQYISHISLRWGKYE